MKDHRKNNNNNDNASGNNIGNNNTDNNGNNNGGSMSYHNISRRLAHMARLQMDILQTEMKVGLCNTSTLVNNYYFFNYLSYYILLSDSCVLWELRVFW